MYAHLPAGRAYSHLAAGTGHLSRCRWPRMFREDLDFEGEEYGLHIDVVAPAARSSFPTHFGGRRRRDRSTGSPVDGDGDRRLVEHSPVMVWRSDRDKKCDYFNRVWLAFTGRTMAQESGDGWAEGSAPGGFLQPVFQKSTRQASISGCHSKWNTGCGATMACIAGFSIAAFLMRTTMETSADTSEAASM